MKIIFLDFDGVLNSHKFFISQEGLKIVRLYGDLDETLDPTKIALINQLVDQTGAQVVVSSSWRITHTLESLNAILARHGATFKLIGETPYLGKYRGAEIADYLSGLKEQPTHFVIIDDDSDMGEVKSHLVKTSMMSGMDEGHLKDCLTMLGVTESA
jgi:hypothetical protein